MSEPLCNRSSPTKLLNLPARTLKNGEKEKKTLASFPSQNVAFVYDQRFIEDLNEDLEEEED